MRVKYVLLAAMLLPAIHAMGAIEVGTKVVVIRPAELRTERGTVTLLTPGSQLDVHGVNEETLTVAAPRIGRVEAAAVIPLAEAEKYFSTLIEKNPQDAVAWSGRGKLAFYQGKLDNAIADFNESLRLRPDSETQSLRAFAWKRKGDKEKAMADFDEAIQLEPKNALAWRVRGATWAGKADYPKALANYSESIRIDPENPESLHHRVIMLSCCQDDTIRNGKQAVEDATKACELTGWKNTLFLSGLALAYAEAGDFDSAIKWQTKIIEMSSKDPAKVSDARLEDFRQKKPFRMTWR